MAQSTCQWIVAFHVKSLIFIIILGLALLFIPNLPPHAEYKDSIVLESTKPFKGKLALNERLSNQELWHKGDLGGAEAFAVLNGEIYTGVGNGDIVKLVGEDIVRITKTGRPCKGPEEESICGRPLGLRFDRNGQLYVADSFYGILKINVKTGAKEVIVSPDTKINGRTAKLFDALDVTSTGDIFWSDASSVFDLENGVYAGFSDPNGRLVHYNPKTKQNRVVIDNLFFANGVVLSEDESEVLVSETFGNRISRYYVKGPKAGTHDVFISGLPGSPDNINRDGKGGYLVSLVFPADAEHPQTFNRLSPYPLVRKLLSRIMGVSQMILEGIDRVFPNDLCSSGARYIGSFASISLFAAKHRGTVIHLSKTGEILDSLHTTKLVMISDAAIFNNTLYLGTPFLDYVGRIQLSDIGWEHLAQDVPKSKTG